MTNAIILHGKPSIERYMDPSQPKPHEANWLPWLAQTLGHMGIPTTIPELPKPYAPVYENCINEALKTPITEDTLVIGHSMGAGLSIRWMSENPDVAVKKLVLVAPWLDPNRRYGSLFDFVLDPSLIERCAGGMAIFYSSHDGKEAKQSAGMLMSTFPGATRKNIPEDGHFMPGNTMRTNKFYKIISELL